jgi:hypothetical protein
MPELKRRRRAASEPDADSADATQEYSPYVPTFQSARPEDPNAQPTFTNENAWQPDYAEDDADIPAPTAEEVFADEALEDPDLYLRSRRNCGRITGACYPASAISSALSRAAR